MDFYFEVGELRFPKGKAKAWLTGRLAEDDRTVQDLFESLEGDVETRLVGDHFSARVLLIDAAFFEPRDALRLALDAAAREGARGTWFSGSDRSGEASKFSGKKRVVEKEARVSAQVMKWILEAGPKTVGRKPTRR